MNENPKSLIFYVLLALLPKTPSEFLSKLSMHQIQFFQGFTELENPLSADMELSSDIPALTSSSSEFR